MRSGAFTAWMIVLTALTVCAGTVSAQVTSYEGDGVLNAPYRGTVTSLREASMDIPYGEVMSHVEPRVSGVSITSPTIEVWLEAGEWDRSVLRMYEGLDASGDEIDLTAPAQVYTEMHHSGNDIKRFSFKAIGTKTLATQSFTVNFRYYFDGHQSTVSKTIKVAPFTGSFLGVGDESEAFLLSTPLLEVTAGNAQLVVPVGRTAEMIGAAFIDKEDDLGPTGIDTNDVVFPGAAESVYIQNWDQFRLGSSEAGKTDWGTPWPGHLVGYRINNDPFGPTGTHYDSQDPSYEAIRRIHYIRPLMQSEYHVACQHYIYDGAGRVVEIRDQAATPNVITLVRTSGVVTRIETSDGRGWDVQSHPVHGWITAVEPDSGKGTRHFTYWSEIDGYRRVATVNNANDDSMYSFIYGPPNGNPADIYFETRFVTVGESGALQMAVEHHVEEGDAERQRREYLAPELYRRYDFLYDTAAGLDHRLATTKTYTGPSLGLGDPHTTTYLHDIGNPDGTMAVTRVDLPDGSWIAYEHDAHVGPQSVDFGFATKSTHNGTHDGALVTYDVDYEFFYQYYGTTYLYHSPRIVKQRDGRGASSEVTYEYDPGGEWISGWCDASGEDVNRLLSVTGPAITLGTSGTRSPETRYIYGSYQSCDLWLHDVEVDYDDGESRKVSYGYDQLLRVNSITVDPGGKNLVTQYQWRDDLPTQDRITIDPDNYHTKRLFDNDGRLWKTQRFVNPGGDTGNSYQIENEYNVHGYLWKEKVDNKDQDGVAIPDEPATIVTEYDYDRLGRLTQRTVDSEGVAQETNYEYTLQSEVWNEYDGSQRGRRTEYEGRGLVENVTPLAEGKTLVHELATKYEYNSLGDVKFVKPPTESAGGPYEEREYDDFGRLKVVKQHAGSRGGNLIETTYEYDAASNLTRTSVEEETEGALSDSTELYDEGGFNYESRRRTSVGADNSTDPVTQRKFDWAGNVVEVRNLGDSTVADRVITTEYDGAGRVETVEDSEGGHTEYVRDGRGNLTERTVKLEGANTAVTTTEYDSLSRAKHITDPQDSAGTRPDRVRRYDSRGNLRRETVRDGSDAEVMTNVYAYDGVSRQTRQVVLADASANTVAMDASVSVDRVVKLDYDADGRLTDRTTYNDDSATPLVTQTKYDDLGRVERITDPAGCYEEWKYTDKGLLEQKHVQDGIGLRTLRFTYDGHDRVATQVAEGPPDLTTTFEHEGLERDVTAPNGVVTRKYYNLLGQFVGTWEDFEGPLSRSVLRTHDRLGNLKQQYVSNSTAQGVPVNHQITTYRHDTLGRQTRIVFPDAPLAQHIDPDECTDCVRLSYDAAGRLDEKLDQGQRTTSFEYDDRGLLHKRTTGTVVDTYEHDALGRVKVAERGTTVDPDAVARAGREYTDLGTLDFETQKIGSAPQLTVDYTHDQAGNRWEMTYPSAESLIYFPTELNQADEIYLDYEDFIDYEYDGRMLAARITTTDAPGGTTTYEHRINYDAHRRRGVLANRLETPRASLPLVIYNLLRDLMGNLRSSTATEGLEKFVGDDRTYSVDRLNRLFETEYHETGDKETAALDRLGNRESFTDRSGQVTAYTGGSLTNEYATVGGVAVAYDDVGNLEVDEAGRQYVYDEANRLIQVSAADETVLANYVYDALGRRVSFEDPVAGVITRYYYDGSRVIEERDADNQRLRYHVHGSQFVDERVATFEDGRRARAGVDDGGDVAAEDGSTGVDWRGGVESRYYLLGPNYSVVGYGNADGSVIERLDFTASGDWVPGGGTAPGYYHDADADFDVDLEDVASFAACFDPAGGQASPECLAAHDYDDAGVSDGDIDLDDFTALTGCYAGPYVTPSQDCARPSRSKSLPDSGTYALHGRPVDVLSDGLVLVDFRARTYLPHHARFLQRDPTGYADGNNLYEAFGSNPLTFLDPFGDLLHLRRR